MEHALTPLFLPSQLARVLWHARRAGPPVGRAAGGVLRAPGGPAGRAGAGRGAAAVGGEWVGERGGGGVGGWGLPTRRWLTAPPPHPPTHRSPRARRTPSRRGWRASPARSPFCCSPGGRGWRPATRTRSSSPRRASCAAASRACCLCSAPRATCWGAARGRCASRWATTTGRWGGRRGRCATRRSWRASGRPFRWRCRARRTSCSLCCPTGRGPGTTTRVGGGVGGRGGTSRPAEPLVTPLPTPPHPPQPTNRRRLLRARQAPLHRAGLPQEPGGAGGRGARRGRRPRRRPRCALRLQALLHHARGAGGGRLGAPVL